MDAWSGVFFQKKKGKVQPTNNDDLQLYHSKGWRSHAELLSSASLLATQVKKSY
jgi:hypothetical protein